MQASFSSDNGQQTLISPLGALFFYDSTTDLAVYLPDVRRLRITYT